MLAVIHAMCIYQILGFFASSSPAQAQLSEMLHLYFLKVRCMHPAYGVGAS